jgi:RND family efflux transporter MFP subunit
MRTFQSAALAAGIAAGLPSVGTAAGFDCLIEPSQVVEVRSPVDGIIASVHVRRGDSVSKGQVLVELQSAAERAGVEGARFRAQMEGQISAARSRLDYATLKVKRLVEMQKENFVSAAARDEADAERKLAEAELALAIENRELARIEHRRAAETLALRTMVAPFNGVVLDRMLHPGDLAEAGSGRKPVLKIAQIDPLKVEIVLPAALHASVKPGARATVTPRGAQTQIAATVSVVDRVVDPASATLVVRIDLPNPARTILGGVRCTAEIAGVSSPAETPRASTKPSP